MFCNTTFPLCKRKKGNKNYFNCLQLTHDECCFWHMNKGRKSTVFCESWGGFNIIGCLNLDRKKVATQANDRQTI